MLSPQVVWWHVHNGADILSMTGVAFLAQMAVAYRWTLIKNIEFVWRWVGFYFSKIDHIKITAS